MKYHVAMHKTDEGYSVSVPGLPGCWSQGRDEAEALNNIREAIQDYLIVAKDSIEQSKLREVEVAA